MSQIFYRSPQASGSHENTHENTTEDLVFEGIDLQELCQKRELPFYLYSKKNIEDRIELYKKNLNSVGLPMSAFYALKANSHPEVLRLFKKHGLGVDTVSGGEINKALKAGFSPQDIIFSGVGKSVAEIKLALETGIYQLHVESVPELQRISELSHGLAVGSVKIALRLNPQVDPVTHPYISTGFKENKFGIDDSQISDALLILKKSPALELRCLSCHIGSQLLDFDALSEAIVKMKATASELKAQGFAITHIDVGGGVGIHYDRDGDSDKTIIQTFAKTLQEQLADRSFVQLMTEPGRVLIARAGILLTKIEYIKETPHKNFVIVNSGMNHLIRPALYQAEHRILPVQKRPGPSLVADVVGPVCESSDFLGLERCFQGLRPGDWLAVCDAGAYGASMASHYNSFPWPEEIFV